MGDPEKHIKTKSDEQKKDENGLIRWSVEEKGTYLQIVLMFGLQLLASVLFYSLVSVI